MDCRAFDFSAPPQLGPEGIPVLQRGRGQALWRQICQALERDILRGVLAPGQRLPPEGALAERFRVNRHTVRRALSALRERELVSIERGRGTFVQEHVIDYAVTRRTRFSENLSRQKRAALGALLAVVEQEAGEEVSRALQIPEGRSVIRLDILRSADGRPVSLSTHFFPLPRFAGIADIFRTTGSVTACLGRFGVVDYLRRETRVTARPPTSEEARLLLQPRGRSLLVTRGVNVDPAGIPVDYGVARYAGDRVRLVVSCDGAV